MKPLIITIALLTTTLLSESLNLNNSGTFSSNQSRTTKPPEPVTYAADLPMYKLFPSIITNTSIINTSLNITVDHAQRIAQKPSVLVARYNPPLIRELFKLRQQYIDIMNKVAYDTSDVQLEGVPRRIDMGYGRGFSNIIKKSGRDKANIEHRAELTAINYLERVIRSFFKIRSVSITDINTYHFTLPPGQYMLCILQRVKDSDPKAGLGSKTAVWWSLFTIEDGIKNEMVLDESNAITWREIFTVQSK